MSMRYVVTGASGFIGWRLCKALKQKGYVAAVARRPTIRTMIDGPFDEVMDWDITQDPPNPKFVPVGRFQGADTVFHLAGRAHTVTDRKDDVDAYRRINVEGTRRVVDAARAAGVRRFVFASSVKAMGEGDGTTRLSAYGESKRQAEDLVFNSGIVEPVVLRLSLVYGPGVEGNLGNMLRAVKARRFPPPPRAPNRRAMVHVDDVVRVAIAAGEHPGAPGQTFVVGDGVAYSTRAIYDAMRDALGMGVPSWALPAPWWRALACAGDALGTVTRRRARFNSESYAKLFGSAWYEPSDVHTALGVPAFLSLEHALAEMVRTL